MGYYHETVAVPVIVERQSRLDRPESEATV